MNTQKTNYRLVAFDNYGDDQNVEGVFAGNNLIACPLYSHDQNLRVFIKDCDRAAKKLKTSEYGLIRKRRRINLHQEDFEEFKLEVLRSVFLTGCLDYLDAFYDRQFPIMGFCLKSGNKVVAKIMRQPKHQGHHVWIVSIPSSFLISSFEKEFPSFWKALRHFVSCTKEHVKINERAVKLIEDKLELSFTKSF